MRTIKFRFWNKLARRFQPAGKYAIDGEGKLVSYDYEAGAYDDPIDLSDSIIVPQQYTGLKDRNGKEIYEGDILKYEVLGATIYYEVFWDEANGAWKNTKENGGNVGSWFDLYEVVGNMFENSELLKQ